MRRLNFAFLICLACATANATEPPKRPPIRLPVGPVLPLPMPDPASPASLNGDQLYIVDVDVAVRVLASPPGLVKITKDVGPIKIRGLFVDGVPGKSETRTYDGKAVYVIEAIGKGRVEILIVPELAAQPDDQDITRRMIDVDAGQGARPPCPDPKPEPKPDPNPLPVVSIAWVIVVEEGMDRTAETATVLNDLKYWKGLDGKGVKWRFYDKDSPDAIAKKYPDFAAEVGLPAVLFLDAAGKKIGAAKLPATTAGIDTLLKGGGK